MQHNAYTHGGTIGIGSNVNANDFPNSHASNHGHALNTIETSLPQINNNSNNSNIVAIAATTSSRGQETGVVSPSDMTSISGSTGVSAVNYGPTFFGNEYHHQLTQSALMANTTTYAAAASTAASTAMLTNYCDAAMMMAAAAVNANQCLQQQQQRIALMANCQTALTCGVGSSNSNNDGTSINKNSSPLNNETSENGNQRPHHINSSLVSSALSSTSSTTSNTSSSSSLLSSNSSSATTSPSITLVNTASLISTNATIHDIAAGHLHPPQSYNRQQHSNHQLHLHHVESPVTSSHLINISEVPLIVDVK